MKTITLQIGNSDDKLTQIEWSEFVKKVQGIIDETPYNDIHFYGCSYGAERWQNACWVFTADEKMFGQMFDELLAARIEYRQDSVGWTEGETVFV